MRVKVQVCNTFFLSKHEQDYSTECYWNSTIVLIQYFLFCSEANAHIILISNFLKHNPPSWKVPFCFDHLQQKLPALHHAVIRNPKTAMLPFVQLVRSPRWVYFGGSVVYIITVHLYLYKILFFFHFKLLYICIDIKKN